MLSRQAVKPTNGEGLRWCGGEGAVVFGRQGQGRKLFEGLVDAPEVSGGGKQQEEDRHGRARIPDRDSAKQTPARRKEKTVGLGRWWKDGRRWGRRASRADDVRSS